MRNEWPDPCPAEIECNHAWCGHRQDANTQRGGTELEFGDMVNVRISSEYPNSWRLLAGDNQMDDSFETKSLAELDAFIANLQKARAFIAEQSEKVSA